MIQIGIASTDITPQASVWLTGYGSRNRKSEGVYQPLNAGAISITGTADDVLILTADVIGYDLAYAAATKLRIAEATGLLRHQIVLTDRQVKGEMAFSRGRSGFGVSRRLPDGKGGIRFAPNPDGAIDRDLDTLWFRNVAGKFIGSLTIFGCHPTSLGDYLIGGDYPGFLCRALSTHTEAPAFFATGCAGNIRPWFRGEDGGFGRPRLEELEAASRQMADEVIQSQQNMIAIDAEGLRVSDEFHQLPYTELPDAATLSDRAENHPNPLIRLWASEMVKLAEAGGLPSCCPQEIQVVQFNENLRAVFLGGEVLTEIGMHIKKALQPSTTMTVAYSNGLIAYVPSVETYDLGGYEVDGSHFYFLRPAPFVKEVEEMIVAKTVE
ncbi:hypothetical protein HYR99_15085, partial [Candidatus Poribacteria bacterium]|nr:hypothetical protein [Candidatus Poribacteria bacterium]